MAKRKKEKNKCEVTGCCYCKAVMAAAIIVLVWVSPAVWSKVIITVLGALMIASAGHCVCRKKK